MIHTNTNRGPHTADSVLSFDGRQMANWCNARLIVAGHTSDVSRFRRLAHARPSSVFRPDMLAGEAQELYSERAASLRPGRLKKAYYFQVRSDDGLEHFRSLSHSHPALRFVLVYGWDDHSYGSYFIARGRPRSYTLSSRLIERVMAKHGVGDNPDGEWPYWPEVVAEAELMDLAEAHWQQSLLRGEAP